MTDIYYETVGLGFPIILLHGNGENHHIFDETVKVLSQKYQCILIDSRYHGKSVHSGEVSYHQMCQDVIDIATYLKLEAYDVIGFSDGGIVALLLGMKDLRVKHMMIMGTNTKPQMLKTIYRWSMSVECLCLIPFCLYNRKARTIYQLTKLMLKQPQIEYKDLENIKIPVLVLAGEFDMVKEIDTMSIGDSLPYGIIKIIKQGNHFLLRDSFQETIKEIEFFLEACHQEDEL